MASGSTSWVMLRRKIMIDSKLVIELDNELKNIIPDAVMRKVAIQRILRVVFIGG